MGEPIPRWRASASLPCGSGPARLYRLLIRPILRRALVTPLSRSAAIRRGVQNTIASG